MSEEVWGQWIEHDGKGCPCLGKFVHIVRVNGMEGFCIAGMKCLLDGIGPNEPGSAWVHVRHPDFRGNFITKYRIRIPRALIEMRQRAADLDVPAPLVTA